MNWAGVSAIYVFEMARARRTLWQSLVAPVITTSLYFLVFGSAIGSRMTAMNGVDYGSFIVPGLILLSVLTQSIFNAMAATSCDPLTVPVPCIPFRYPDDGCWARASEMCRLMIAMGRSPGKVWIDGSLEVISSNKPRHRYSQSRISDPSMPIPHR